MDKNHYTLKIEGNQYNDSKTSSPVQRVDSKELNRTNDNILFGILGGIQLVVLLVAAQLFFSDFMVLKLLKYFALFCVLGYALGTQRAYMQNIYTIKNGIQLGVIVTTTIAIIFTLANILIFLISPNFVFDSFLMQADSIENLVELSGNLFLEILFFGVILTCLILFLTKPQTAITK